jgi:S-adenosylmethionine hydrolase
MAVITLLTDFGTDDEYVGQVKGVILSLCPAVTIVDITHQIDSQDITQAAFAIRCAYHYFPKGTVHLIVVDPGVGTERGLLALKLKDHFFIAPDNGVLTLLLNQAEIASLVLITNSNYYGATVSRTFHGRDIIAPVGAHIAKGLEIKELGPEVDVQSVVCLDGLRARRTENGELRGEVVSIDHFGNLITNIDSEILTESFHAGRKNRVLVKIGSNTISGLTGTYANARSKIPLALIGSRGYLEIAVNQGNAAQVLKIKKGDGVRVVDKLS